MTDYLLKVRSGKNRYQRKYEIFNEVITDLLAMEAREFLHSQNIYLLEPSEITQADISNTNTSEVVKQIIQPFLSTACSPQNSGFIGVLAVKMQFHSHFHA